MTGSIIDRDTAERVLLLMAKDAGRLAGFAGLMFMMHIYFALSREYLDSVAVLMMSGWLFAIGLGPAIGIESNEMRYRGYLFLASLPLRKREIVLGRMIPVVLLAVLYAVSVWVFFGLSAADPAMSSLARKWLAMNLSAYFIIIGAVYLVRFRYGYAKAASMKLAVMVLGFVVPIILNEMIIRRSVLAENILDSIEGSSAMLCASAVAVSIAACAALAAAAVRAFEREVPE